MSLSRTIKSSSKTYLRNKTPIGQGGNSDVYEVTCEGQPLALKIQKQGLPKRQKDRFLREIDILCNCQNIEGVIRIHDSFAGDTNAPPFYVMDLATPSLRWIEDKNAYDIISIFLTISKTLKELQNRGIAHRDIKPENILFIGDTPYLADFGLAHREGDPRITNEGDRRVGAKMTIAPEMIRDPYNANYFLADVYSLAKTLWIFLTHDHDCFEGCYSTHGKESLWDYPVKVIGHIEDFLTSCTSNFPLKRWTYDQTIEFFGKWLEISAQPDSNRQEAWRLLKKRIFPHIQPETAEWTSIDDIIMVFDLVLNRSCWNHTFLPTGGGLDLTKVTRSDEIGCLEFNFQSMLHMIRPKKLSFFSPGDDQYGAQDYFILEADDIGFVTDSTDDYREFSTMLAPNIYTDYKCGEWNDYNGKELPEGARQVTRWRKGKFAIFMGGSFYNQKGLLINGKLVDSYLALHEKYDVVDFFNTFKMLLSEHPMTKITAPKFIPNTQTRLRKQLLTIDQISTIKNFTKQLWEVKEPAPRGSLKISEIFSDDFLDYTQRKTEIISSLNAENLQLITAVMYAGRDNRPPFGDTLGEMIAQHPNYDSNFNSLSGKSASIIAKYLEKGLTMYK